MVVEAHWPQQGQGNLDIWLYLTTIKDIDGLFDVNGEEMY